MKATKKISSNGKWSLVIGMASGFATLATFSIAIYNDTQAAVIWAGLAIASSLLVLFLNNKETKGKYCTKINTLNA